MTTRVETLERKFKHLEADWELWYDKYRRLAATLSKRIEREANGPGSPAEPETTTRPGETRTVKNPAARRLLGYRD